MIIIETENIIQGEGYTYFYVDLLTGPKFNENV